jgi:heat-inducible transcriptional repressor
MELTARQNRLLRTVIEAFICSGGPVSSAEVARRQKSEPLSPATIRTELGQLTRLGLLHQAHHTAGRTPTEEGLRVYLNALINTKMHPWDRTHLDAAVAAAPPEDLPGHIGQCLAGISGEVAVVGVPRFLGTTFREVGLMRCGEGCFIAYFVSPGGRVQQKMVQVDFDLTTEELLRAQNYLNDRLTQRTLPEVRACIERELCTERVRRDRLLRAALTLGLRGLPEPQLELVVEGKAQLATKPEFADVNKLRAVLEAIETKAVLLELLDQIIGGADVTIKLASEHRVRGVADLAMVGGSSAMAAGGSSATISLVGPARMDYGRVVPLVRYALVLLERHWISV